MLFVGTPIRPIDITTSVDAAIELALTEIRASVERRGLTSDDVVFLSVQARTHAELTEVRSALRHVLTRPTVVSANVASKISDRRILVDALASSGERRAIGTVDGVMCEALAIEEPREHLFVMAGKTEDTGEKRDVEVATTRALSRVGALLREASLDLSNIVDVHAYLARMDDYALMNAAYGMVLFETPAPRSAVELEVDGSGIVAFNVIASSSTTKETVRISKWPIPNPFFPFALGSRCNETIRTLGHAAFNEANQIDPLGDVVGQTKRTISNLREVLLSGTGSPDDPPHVTSATVWTSEWSALNAIRAELVAAFGQDLEVGLRCATGFAVPGELLKVCVTANSFSAPKKASFS